MRKLHVRSSGRTLVAMLLVAVAIILGGAIWRLIDAALASPDDSAAELYFTRMAYLMLVQYNSAAEYAGAAGYARGSLVYRAIQGSICLKAHISGQRVGRSRASIRTPRRRR